MTERTFLAVDADAALWGAAPVAAAAFVSRAPSTPALRPLVAWLHLCDERLDAGVEERVLPDGAVHLSIHLAERPAVLADGAVVPGDVAEVVGPGTAPSIVRMAGRQEGVGLCLHPGGAAALLGVPAGELAGRIVSLDALWRGTAATLVERLLAVPHGPARLAVLERALVERLARAGDAPAPSHRAAREAVRRLRATGGQLTVRALAAELGLGARRLEQLFHRDVGLPPKAVARLARFHAALRLARREPALGWSAVAQRAGYADQPHLVHEVRALSGLTPGALRERFAFPQDGAAVPR